MAGCQVHLYNELKEKQEQGEDLTPDEQQITNASSKEELEEVAPDNYGPASEEYEGTYCSFCYRMGEIGAAFFGVSPIVVFATVAALVSFYLAGQLNPIFVGAGAILGVIIGGPVWWSFHKKVRLKGYFPALGPDLGPYVEKILGAIGIKATATMRREEEDFETLADDTGSEEDADIILDEMSTDSDNSTEQTAASSVDQDMADVARQQRSKRLELQTENDNLRSKNKRLESKVEETRETKEDLEETVKAYENGAHIAGAGGNVDPEVVWELNIPAYNDNGNKGGNLQFYAIDFVRYDHPEHGEIPLPFGGWDKATVEKMDVLLFAERSPRILLSVSRRSSNIIRHLA